MPTKLDARTDLLQKISCLSASDIQKLKIFISGMEAAKATRQEMLDEHQKESA